MHFSVPKTKNKTKFGRYNKHDILKISQYWYQLAQVVHGATA